GHCCRIGQAQQQRSSAPQLLFQQPRGRSRRVRFQGIAANQLRQPVGLVRRSRAHGTHLVKRDRNSAVRKLPRRFAPRESAARDDKWFHHRRFQSYYTSQGFDDGATGIRTSWSRWTRIHPRFLITTSLQLPLSTRLAVAIPTPPPTAAPTPAPCNPCPIAPM